MTARLSLWIRVLASLGRFVWQGDKHLLITLRVPKVATYRQVYRHEPKYWIFICIVYHVLFPIRYSIRAAQQDSAFKMTHI